MKHSHPTELGSLGRHRAFLGKRAKSGSVVPFPMSPKQIFATQVKGLMRRLKAIHCSSVVIGLSGGLDSTLALLVAVEAFHKLKYDLSGIHVYTMPGFGTSGRTRGNAEKLAEGLGVKLERISIVKSVRQHLKDIGHDGQTADITYENAQARMRTLILMDKANMTGGIVLGTGDMSEIALGWCTYNGDHMSMFAVNNGVPKTKVREVCAYRAKALSSKACTAVEDIIATPVSPELIKGQVTEDKIGPYELHDFFLWNFIMNEMGPKALARSAEDYFKGAFAAEVIDRTLKIFFRRFFTQAFKRNCQPDGIKVFPFELSLHDWWMPSDIGIVKLHG